MCKQTCLKCGKTFDRINEEAHSEFQCLGCQARMRISRADSFHKSGDFPGVEGYKREAFQLKTWGKVLD